jgi:predicted flap endonuclease-1-like 5' DNA nuclease
MRYLIATYWAWFVLALLVGGVIGYWLSWRRTSWGKFGSWPWSAAILFVVGLIVALLHLLPGRSGLYLETLLHLTFWYVLGGMLGGWLRSVQARAGLAAEKAAEDARLAATTAKAAEDARLAAAAAKAAEDARLAAASAKAAEDARQIAAAAKAAEDARQATAAAKAAEDARQAAAAAKAAEDARLAAASVKAAEDARLAAASAKAAEDARQIAAAAKAAEDARQAAAAVQQPLAADADHPGARPSGIVAPPHPDDLKRIRGIGPQNEGRLHGLGIWHFTQIAAWNAENVNWVSSYLAFPGRIDREKWIDQARELAVGHETEFSRRVAAGMVPTKKDDGSYGQSNVQIVK